MSSLRHERSDVASTITLADPANRNRLDDAAVAALHAALDASELRALLVLRGEGDGFSAGRPHAPGGHPDGPAAAQHALGELVRLNHRIATWPAPVIAAVHGYAHGAALGLLQHADIVIAAEGTRFSFPEITYNLPPALVASYLRRYLGEKAVRYLVMTGQEIDAQRALGWGLVTEVVPPAQLDAAVAALVADLGSRLEAEVAIKAALAEFSPWPGDLAQTMEQGVASVMRWARRGKG